MSPRPVPRVGALVRSHLRELRGQLRFRMGMVLQRLLRRQEAATRLDPAEIHSVLIGRVNGRLGNTLFLTPMIERLHALLPDAHIDLAVSYPNAVTLLADMPGVRRIILFPHKGRGLVFQYLRALRELRAAHYDLVVDPTPFSTSGRLILTATHARFRLGFKVRSQWADLTHALPMPPQIRHQGQLPAYLVSTALGAAWDPDAVKLWLPLAPQELDAARQRVDAAVGPVGDRPRVGFFAHATGFKMLPASWWNRFWTQLRVRHPEVVPVEFLPAPEALPTVPGVASLNLRSQRELTAAIAGLRMFISADAGPMHLASTTATPTMGLFQVTDPGLYGPLKSTDRSIRVNHLTPEEVAAQVSAALSGSVGEQG